MSKYIKSESVKFKVSHVACALIAAVAASATLTVHAATPLYWTGGEKATSTEECEKYVNHIIDAMKQSGHLIEVKK